MGSDFMAGHTQRLLSSVVWGGGVLVGFVRVCVSREGDRALYSSGFWEEEGGSW